MTSVEYIRILPELVLTAFGRINGGNARGDQELADRFLNLFYRI